MSTDAEQLAEAQWELGKRKGLSPYLVRKGDLSEAEALRKLALQTDIVATLQQHAEEESGQLALFGVA